MNPGFLFFKLVAKAAVHCAGLGAAGELAAEALPEMARAVYRWWGEGRSPAQLRAEAGAVALLSDAEARQFAQLAVEQEAAFQPEALKLVLLTYLAQVPLAVRQTQRRLGEGGTRLDGAADVLALLPPRLPRLRQGDRAPGFSDWRLEQLLGLGGFGEVWKATNPHLPPVALKFCLDPALADGLRNEARLLGQVARQGRHPGIVALLDTALSAEPPCLKYEYVEGGDLAAAAGAWQAEPATLSGRCLAVVRRLAEAVGFAHRLSPPIVHRDLKPGNVLLRRKSQISNDKSQRNLKPEIPIGEGAPDAGVEGCDLRVVCDLSFAGWDFEVKVTDFGIGAVVARHGDAALTALRGACTPLYASPQQLRGEPADPRDDVFALGVLWFQLLSGQLAERPGADWRLDLAQLHVPPAVLDVIERCLASKADRRFPDAQALADALAAPELCPSRIDRSRVVVQMALAELDEDSDGDADDPLGLAAQIQQSLRRTQRALAAAVELTEKHHDYAGAVRLLERLPEPFRDNALLEVVRERRDRVQLLRNRILNDARQRRFDGLADRLDDLLALTPNDAEMIRLRQTVPWLPGEEVVNSLGMRLRLVEPGLFVMGAAEGEAGRQPCEGPLHEVDISRRFYLGAHPVTQEQYQAVTGVNPSHFRTVPGHDTRRFPVESVSWEEAAEFCRRLSGLPDECRRGRVYRLPTEAEWEYACRAGTTTPFHYGAALSGGQANFDGRHPYGAGRRGDFLHRTSAVGDYQANAWGLCDMHGNVWEWTADWFAERSYRHSPRRDPSGPATGTARVLRGGSWQNHGRLCRSACRDWVSPGYHGLNVGFRVVLEVAVAQERAPK